MQAIKALVIGMGVLIVAGMIILVYGVTTNLGKSSLGGGSVQGFGDVRVTLPAGAAVEDARLDGETLVVRVRGPGDTAQVILFRRDDGKRLGGFHFEAPAR
jgi:hypothetical protein